jgi:hypothetical protein
MIWAVGLGLFSTLDQSSGLGKQIGYGILTGVGVGNTLQPYAPVHPVPLSRPSTNNHSEPSSQSKPASNAATWPS